MVFVVEINQTAVVPITTSEGGSPALFVRVYYGINTLIKYYVTSVLIHSIGHSVMGVVPASFASLSSVHLLICAMQKNERLVMVSAGACECRFPLGSALPHLPSTPFAVELWHENITTDKISKAVI